jgi:hypothetical protein
MGLKKLPDDLNVESNDVVLYAVRSTPTAQDQVRLTRLRSGSTQMIEFDGGGKTDLQLGIPKIAPLDSVVNIIDGWTWTGEFIAACTRLGKMPTVYLGYHVPGGPERGAKYNGKMFHEDFEIKPIARAELGTRYLDRLSQSLASLRQEAPLKLQSVAIKLREATPAKSALRISGHMMPEHYQDARAPQPFGSIAKFSPDALPAEGRVVVAMTSVKVPQLSINAANVNRDVLMYSSPQRGRDDSAANIFYVDPHLPMEDASIAIEDYDVPVLPLSGVIQAATYWGLIAETYPPTTGD